VSENAPAVTAPVAEAAPLEPWPGSRFLRWTSGSFLIAVVSFVLCVVLPRGAESQAGNVFLDPVWDDGKAEVAHYDVDGHDLLLACLRDDDVLRLLWEDSPRRTLTVRVARHEPTRLLDAASGMQDLGRETFVAIEGGVRTTHPGLTGQAKDVLPGGTWLEDQLPVTLRALPLEKGFERSIFLLPSIAANPRSKLLPAQVRVEGDETLTTPAGDLPCARVTVTTAGQEHATFWVGRTGLHALARFVGTDGRTATLRSIERAAPSK
jgi:hypothetical protein